MVLVFFVARPLYYLELVVGQFSSLGPIKVWNCVPALKGRQLIKQLLQQLLTILLSLTGVGFAQMISGSYVCIFYNYLMALTLYYFFASFSSPLPWTVCDDSQEWSKNCSQSLKSVHSNSSTENFAELPDKYFQLSSWLNSITNHK